MPKVKKNISADTKRSFLQHLMFGMLGLLILMNWSVHRPLDYSIYDETFVAAAKSEKEHSKNFLNGILGNYEIEGGDERFEKYQLALYINSETDSIINDLDVQIDNFEIGNKGNNSKVIDRIVKLRDSLHFSYLLFSGFPFSDKDIIRFKNLFQLRTNLWSHLPNNYRKVVLYSLRQDVLKARSIYHEIICSSMHDQTMHFEGFRSHVILDSSSFFTDNIRATIMLTKGLPLHRDGVYAAAANIGLIDSVDMDDIFQWKSKAKIIGLNTVIGSLRFKNRDTDVTRPFSFSYFVSAPGIAFHLDKANLCYVGVPNPISISVPGYPADKIKLRVAGAKVSKIEDGRFEIFFSKIPSAKVYAYVEATNEQGRTSTVHSMELKVKNLPVPITNLEPFKECGMAIDNFFSSKSLQLFSSDSAFQMDYDVVSFQVECITRDSKYIEPITVYGAEYTNSHELMSVFNDAKVGDKFIFSNIRAKAANGKLYEVLPISILLK